MGVWFVNILTRAEQFTNWLRNGRPNTFWLTGFFNPTGFLTANRQEVCRKHSKDNWALDDVVNGFEVLKQEREEVKKGPDEGIYIYGLFLDCAKWEKAKDRLADSDPKARCTPPLPPPRPNRRHIPHLPYLCSCFPPVKLLSAHHTARPWQVLFAPLPVLWITGCLSSAFKGDKNVYYSCPTYKAPRRTGLNYITSVELRTEDAPSKWVLRGVALLATID